MSQNCINNDSKVVVALDFDNDKDALALVNTVTPEACRLKVGKELFTACGPDLVRELTAKGFDVFLDLKFHDIPNTVAKACKAATELGVWMVNVHASGGKQMMLAARQAVDAYEVKPLLIAVTVLTSMDEQSLQGIGWQKPVKETVLQWATLAKECGLDGVVCSAQEAAMLKQALGKAFILVTPGIRLASDAKGDQKRVVTPEQAVQNGVDYLVMGRSITQAEQPAKVLEMINESLKAV